MALGEYSRGHFYFESDGNFNLFKFDTDIMRLPQIGSYRVRDIDVNKPWIISDNIYGVPELWWFVMKYNGIKRMTRDLYSGQVLKYPSISSFHELKERYST